MCLYSKSSDKQNMIILAFDIGICNLAYALADYNEETADLKLLEWCLLPLKKPKEKKNFTEVSSAVVKEINDIFWNKQVDVVLIENQPVMKNPVMKSIQIMIYTIFMLKKQQNNLDTIIKLVSAQSKLKVLEKDKIDCSHITTTDKYKRNKQLGIEYARYYLSLTKQDEKWCTFFEDSRKADDISEALLYIINYIGM